MGHLMQNASGAVIIIIRARGRVFREIPVPIVGAGHDGIGAGDGVQEGCSIRAVGVLVVAVDLWPGGADADHVVVDGADFGLLRGGGGAEPVGEVVGGGVGCGVGCARQGDGVCYGGLEGGGLGAGAAAIGDSALLDAR